jgi:two-component system, OmpR family, phosphate regulon response regulator OmpR
MANILIVEDDKDLNFAYRLILERENHIVESAFNGEEALQKLQDFRADIILLDLLMPIKSGVEFLQNYDIVNDHPDVKILVFTNIDNAPEINEALRLGADKCIIKAWTSPQGLVKLIDNMLEPIEKEEEGAPAGGKHKG